MKFKFENVIYNAFLIIHAIVLRTTFTLADEEKALVEFNPRDAGVKRGKFADLRRCIEQQVRRTDQLKIVNSYMRRRLLEKLM